MTCIDFSSMLLFILSQCIWLNHCFESDSSISFWKTAQSDTVIRHSRTLPKPTSSHVDYIWIGQPGAQLEAEGSLIITMEGVMVQEKFLEWWAGSFRPLLTKNNPHRSENSSLLLLSDLVSSCRFHLLKLFWKYTWHCDITFTSFICITSLQHVKRHISEKGIV